MRRLACGLADAGLQRGEHVVVIGENRPRLYAAMLAAQALGAVPVPLYQDAATTEFVFPIQNAEVRFAIVEDQEQVDKLLEMRERLPAARRTSGTTSRAACATTTSPGLASLDDPDRAGRGWNAGPPGRHSTPASPRAGRTTWRRCSSPPAPPASPRAWCTPTSRCCDRAAAGARFDKLTDDEEVLAYLPPAWIGQNIFSYAQWLACGYVVNCPESSETVTIDLKEIGPTYYFAPPRVFEGLLTSVMIRMEDASALKRWMFKRAMDLARRVGPAIMDGKPVGALDRLKYALGNLSSTARCATRWA